jgi:hypothetical protein
MSVKSAAQHATGLTPVRRWWLRPDPPSDLLHIVATLDDAREKKSDGNKRHEMEGYAVSEHDERRRRNAELFRAFRRWRSDIASVAACAVRLRWNLVAHAGSLEDVSPFPARATVTMLKMLPEVVGAIKLFRLIAFPKFMLRGEMINAGLPIGRNGKLFSAVTAYVGKIGPVRRWVKCRLVITRQRCARPRVFPQVKRVLVPLGFILVFEPVVAVLAAILLFHLV